MMFDGIYFLWFANISVGKHAASDYWFSQLMCVQPDILITSAAWRHRPSGPAHAPKPPAGRITPPNPSHHEGLRLPAVKKTATRMAAKTPAFTEGHHHFVDGSCIVERAKS
jgi:hypothetical protein